MAKKRTYSTQSVESVSIEGLLPALRPGCIVALDVAKEKFVGALASADGNAVKLFRFDHPVQTRRFLELVAALQGALGPDKVKVAMEPTGTYGDAIRYQLAKQGVAVWMVAPKKTFDSRALFDDVASLHDPKSAVNVAKLCAMGLATEWHQQSEQRVQLRALVELRAHEFDAEERCFGRMEALLARHWPEYSQWLDVRSQKSALALLHAFPSPARLSADADGAEALMRRVSQSRLPKEKIHGILSGSTQTLGLPPTLYEEQMLATLAQQAAEARGRAEHVEREMSRAGSSDEVFVRLESYMGTFTAAAIVALCDPRQYDKARQLEKAVGLNLREKSSGNDRRDQIRVRITKRGPSLIRKLLFMFALRMIRACPEVHAWYVRRRSYAGGIKPRAVIAVMRKLVRAVFHVARGSTFDPAKLFDLRRLEMPLRERRAALLRRNAKTNAEVNATAI